MGMPMLMSRHLYLNPAQTVAHLVQEQAHRLDLAITTAFVDVRTAWAAAVAQGLAAGLVRRQAWCLLHACKPPCVTHACVPSRRRVCCC
jgi:hypothetical protein